MSDANTPNQSPPEMEDELKPYTDAAQDIVQMLMKYYYDESRGIHAETIISAASVLIGEWALVSLEQPLPEKGWVLASGTNELLIEGKDPLLDVIRLAASRQGLSDEEMPDPVEVVARTVSAFGGSYPPYTVPRKHQPAEWSMFAGPRFREQVKEIITKHGLTIKQAPMACAMATAFLMEMVKDVLDAKTAITLVYENAIAAARMAPMSPEYADELLKNVTEKQNAGDQA